MKALSLRRASQYGQWAGHFERKQTDRVSIPTGALKTAASGGSCGSSSSHRQIIRRNCTESEPAPLPLDQALADQKSPDRTLARRRGTWQRAAFREPEIRE